MRMKKRAASSWEMSRKEVETETVNEEEDNLNEEVWR